MPGVYFKMLKSDDLLSIPGTPVSKHGHLQELNSSELHASGSGGNWHSFSNQELGQTLSAGSGSSTPCASLAAFGAGPFGSCGDPAAVQG